MEAFFVVLLALVMVAVGVLALLAARRVRVLAEGLDETEEHDA